MRSRQPFKRTVSPLAARLFLQFVFVSPAAINNAIIGSIFHYLCNSSITPGIL